MNFQTAYSWIQVLSTGFLPSVFPVLLELSWFWIPPLPPVACRGAQVDTRPVRKGNILLRGIWEGHMLAWTCGQESKLRAGKVSGRIGLWNDIYGKYFFQDRASSPLQ